MSRNNSHSVRGFLQQVLPSREVQGEKTFTVQEFIVKTEEQYPQLIKFEIYDDKTSQVKGIPTGQAVEVSFSQRGREYQGKIYNSNRAWKVETVQGGLAPTPKAASAKKAAPAAATAPASSEGDEKPF